MDKAELIRHEIEKRRDHNLAIGNPLFAAMAEEDIELLSFIDSMQKEPVIEDLEIEINKEILKLHTAPCYDELKAFALHFIEWQKKQMMKDAIDAHCFGFQGGVALFSFRLPADNYLIGSEVKVKVIVIKED